MAELTQTNDFMMKQEALWGFLSKFQPREWNISAKQWYEQVMKYARDYSFDVDVSVYMIDHNSLHTEVTSHREEVERIVWSIMKKFHDDLKILDIRNDGFYCSNVKNVVTTQKGLDTLASLYSNVLDVFCGNARLMEDSLGGPRDSADQAMMLCGMGQYEEPIETIKEDYNLQNVKKKILKVGNKPKPVESAPSRNDVELTVEERGKVYTPRAQKFLMKAKKDKYLTVTGKDKYEWSLIKKGKKGHIVSLCFFLVEAYNDQDSPPYGLLEEMFDEKNLSQSAHQMKNQPYYKYYLGDPHYTRKNASIPKWFDKLDLDKL